MLLLASGLTFGLAACEDEVLVETKDETKANELLTAIDAADEQLATLSVENNTLTVSNAQAEKLIEQYADLRAELIDPYSDPTEVHYTVTVLSSSNAVVSNGRTKGFEGASVVVEQNGLVLEPSSSSNGLYLFTGLKPGYVYVRVSAAEHTSVEYRAYIYLNDGQDVASATSFNAQTQVVLYPVSGAKAARFIGNAYANNTILNDTLNRKYGSAAAFGANANSYIAPPNSITYDYTYEWNNISTYNVYGVDVNSSSKVVQYEKALAGHKIFAYPDVEEFANNDWNTQNGVIYNIIYKGLVTSTTIGADGSYSLPVVSSAQFFNEGVVNQIAISVDSYVAPHTRFTAWGGSYYGEENETGSVEVDIKYYNNTNAGVSPYDGAGSTVAISPAAAAVVKRRVITEDWIYYPYFIGSTNVEAWDETVPVAGETRNLNIYFQPRQRD